MLPATTKGICGHGVKKKLTYIYTLYVYIYIRGVSGRSVNGFIKSVFVVVTTAEKNYFFSSSYSLARFITLSLSLSLALSLSLTIYLSLSLPLSHPLTLSPTTPRRRRRRPPSSSFAGG